MLRTYRPQRVGSGKDAAQVADRNFDEISDAIAKINYVVHQHESQLDRIKKDMLGVLVDTIHDSASVDFTFDKNLGEMSAAVIAGGHSHENIQTITNAVNTWYRIARTNTTHGSALYRIAWSSTTYRGTVVFSVAYQSPSTVPNVTLVSATHEAI